VVRGPAGGLLGVVASLLLPAPPPQPPQSRPSSRAATINHIR
jgi:hypothetical protein